MDFLRSKIEMQKKIKEQEANLSQLEEDKKSLSNEIAKLKKEIAQYKKENSEYENKYLHTNLECEFCYTTLQKEFEYCPKCGKKVTKTTLIDSCNINKNIFCTEEDRDGVLINQYNGFNDKKIIIPSHINGKPVIGIWNSVFEKCVDLEEVIFEEGCKYIGKRVFAGCSRLKKVRLPKSLIEIGDYAFNNCALEEIAISPNVKVIGAFAFSYCSSLKKILLPDSLKCISANMLSNTALEEIAIPQSVVHIGTSAFSDSKLKEVELPYNLYSIGGYAFNISSLSKIIIHSNVKVINADIFGKRGITPIIYCAAGSKALLYARKYGLECQEISSQPLSNTKTCSSGIILVFGTLRKGENLATWYKYFGLCKAETWSWSVRSWNELCIEKDMDMEDALRLQMSIRRFVSSHSDYSRPGAMCSIQELSICEHWGTSVV